MIKAGNFQFSIFNFPSLAAITLIFALTVMTAGSAQAVTMDQAMPGAHPSLPEGHPSLNENGPLIQASAAATEDRTAFEKALQLNAFRLLAIQHNDQVKILDSWARQSLSNIRHRQSIDGQDPLYTALDMMFRPEAWMQRKIVYIQSIPIRQQLAAFAKTEKESDEIMHTALVSPAFLLREDVRRKMEELQRDAIIAPQVRKVMMALQTFLMLPDTFLILPPPAGEHGTIWRHPVDLRAKQVKDPELLKKLEIDPTTVAGYSDEQALRGYLAMQQLGRGWLTNDAEMANLGIAGFVNLLPKVNPAEYRSETKREVELWYNRTFYGTILDVFLYGIAMVLFLLTAVGISRKIWFVAMPVFTLAVVAHISAMAVRWWLAERIPIQNQFESVLGAAMLGCVIGCMLELWKRKGFFGLAMSFVGFMAMTACFSAPYVFGNDLGASIAKVAGILEDYWLYIHVNIVIMSYSLIGASFCIGALYLLARLWHWISPVDGGQRVAVSGQTMAVESAFGNDTSILRSRRELLASLDAANVVLLQIAFWALGIGILCGAVWADHSWGRPWGWDPKETFALVTWLVYLIIVHLRVATKMKADWTAALSIIGFAIMMFNWIGVNFFLVGLHSYA